MSRADHHLCSVCVGILPVPRMAARAPADYSARTTSATPEKSTPPRARRATPRAPRGGARAPNRLCVRAGTHGDGDRQLVGPCRFGAMAVVAAPKSACSRSSSTERSSCSACSTCPGARPRSQLSATRTRYVGPDGCELKGPAAQKTWSRRRSRVWMLRRAGAYSAYTAGLDAPAMRGHAPALLHAAGLVIGRVSASSRYGQGRRGEDAVGVVGLFGGEQALGVGTVGVGGLLLVFGAEQVGKCPGARADAALRRRRRPSGGARCRRCPARRRSARPSGAGRARRRRVRRSARGSPRRGSGGR